MEPEKKSNGALVGSIIIIVILIIGGIYLWKNSMEDKAPIENSELSSEEDITNSAATIEAELNSMDLEGLDSGI